MVKCINQIIYSTLMLDTNLKKIQLSLVSSEWLFLSMISDKFRVNFLGIFKYRSILKITKIWNIKKKLSG